MNHKLLLVVEQGSINYAIPGGVQVCTKELIDYFHLTDFSLELFPVQTTRRISDRIKKKLGIDIYNSFNFPAVADELALKIKRDNISIVALNQIEFASLVPLIKKKVSRRVVFIGLSHGNESGDFLLSIPTNPLLKLWKLGKLILTESRIYQEYLDGVVVISEHEVGVNQWLGATYLFVLPRMLKDNSLPWQPFENRVGFVGTLNHYPNLAGLRSVLKHLDELHFPGKVRIVGGPKDVGEKLAEEFSCAEYLGKLNEDELAEEAKTWSIFLNPVFWYSRGSSTKLAQGINWGLPVLTTPAGKRGCSLADERIVLDNHDPYLFAQKIADVCRDEPLLFELRDSVKINLSAFNEISFATRLEHFIRKVAKIESKIPA